MQNVRRSGSQYKVNVSADGEVRGTVQVDGANLQVSRTGVSVLAHIFLHLNDGKDGKNSLLSFCMFLCDIRKFSFGFQQRNKEDVGTLRNESVEYHEGEEKRYNLNRDLIVLLHVGWKLHIVVLFNSS